MAPAPSIKRNTASPASSSEGSGLITSRDNKWLKLFRAALRGTGPERGDPIAVEGPKLVEEAIVSGLEADAILVSAGGEAHLPRILQAASESEAGVRRERIFRTTDQLFASCAGTETPQGVAALFRQPVWNLEDVLHGRAQPDGSLIGEMPLIVVLAGLQDPGNVGTILRSAEAFTATGAIAARGTADPWSPKALRASAGSALRLPLLRGMAIPVLLAQLKMHQIQIVAASLHAATQNGSRAESVDVLRNSAAIFIGSEGAGLPPEVERSADATLSIPMSESVESLNAAVAASVLLYEAARQRREHL